MDESIQEELVVYIREVVITMSLFGNDCLMFILEFVGFLKQ